MAKLCTWKVDPAPTGKYRSFAHRGWPSADYAGDRIAAKIYCEDDYEPQNARTGKHAALRLHVADYSVTPWKWRKAKGEFKTIQEAKDALVKILLDHPELMPPTENKQ